MNLKKEKTVTALSSISGATSIFGSRQVCHMICTGIITLLSLFGITLAGMPLFFLLQYAVLIWTIAVFFLSLSIIMRLSGMCISKNMLLFNTGLLIAGTPFARLQTFNTLFWIIGGTTLFVSILLMIQERRKKYGTKK